MTAVSTEVSPASVTLRDAPPTDWIRALALPDGKTHSELTERFRWDLPEHLNMAEEVCDRWADAAPDRVALIVDGDTSAPEISYGQLRKMADAMADLLHARGVKQGDRVGIYLGQSPWTPATHIAVWKLGAISLPLFPLFGPDSLRPRLSDAGARVVVTDAVGAEVLTTHCRDLLDADGVVLPPKTLAKAAPRVPVRTGPDDPAVLIYTSGTTGAAKGALHGHRVLRGHLPGVQLSHNLMPQSADVLWTPADWAWIGGLFDVLMPGLALGVPVVASRARRFVPADCAALIARHGIRNVFFPPTALRALKAAEISIPGLRSVASGGEPLGAEMLDWGRAALGLEINEFYGQTECNMTVSACSDLFPVRPGWIGRAVPGHDLEVIDASGQPTPDEGDIAIRRGSASMFLGYWDNEAATAAKYRGSWMLTGDRGQIDTDGHVRFVGRDDDVITSSGYRIGPAEIEDCLLTHPAVATAGVVGVPDPARTEIVVAFVVLRDGETETPELRAALKDHVKHRLAAHEYPRRLYVVEALPMTVTGKVLRRELRRIAEEMQT